MVKTVKSKFIILILTIVVLGTGLPTLFLLSQLKDNFTERSFDMLDVTLDVVTNSIVFSIKGGVNNNLQEIIDGVAKNKKLNVLRIISPSRTILYSSNESENGKPLEAVAADHANIITESSFRTRDFEIKENDNYIAIHTLLNEKYCQNCHQGKGRILAYLSVNTKETTAEKFFYTGIVHTFFLGLVIFLLIIFSLYISYNKLINNPLKKVMNGLDEVGDGNLDISLDVQNNNEFGIINNHFNTMVKSMKTAKEKIEELSFSELEHTDKLATIGQLTAEISHEINNPTAIIMSRADYLMMEADDNSELKKYSEDFDAIYSQTEKISAITKNVLKYSRKLPNKFVKVDLKESIKSALTILKLKIQKKGISVSEKYSENTYVLGNSIQLEQVVINILHNAVDAMDVGGKIDIKIVEGNNNLVLGLSDNGHGMDAETKEKIFAPFFTTKPENVGTGLGMFIIERICKNHNAKITFESELGVGTTFNIHFNKFEENA